MTNTEVDIHTPEVVEGVVVHELRDGAVLTYIRSHEAWYATSNGITLPELSVVASYPDGGCSWEFSLAEHDFAPDTVSLKIFNDAFAAFLEMPEFFRALHEDCPESIDAVCRILDSMGALDKTERESPYKKRVPDLRVSIAVQTVVDKGWTVRNENGEEVLP